MSWQALEGLIKLKMDIGKTPGGATIHLLLVGVIFPSLKRFFYPPRGPFLRKGYCCLTVVPPPDSPLPYRAALIGKLGQCQNAEKVEIIWVSLTDFDDRSATHQKWPSREIPRRPCKNPSGNTLQLLTSHCFTHVFVYALLCDAPVVRHWAWLRWGMRNGVPSCTRKFKQNKCTHREYSFAPEKQEEPSESTSIGANLRQPLVQSTYAQFVQT